MNEDRGRKETQWSVAHFVCVESMKTSGGKREREREENITIKVPYVRSSLKSKI